MRKYILIFATIFLTNGIIIAQNSNELLKFTTIYTYSFSNEGLSSTEQKAEWSIREYPQKHVRLETEGKVSKYRIDQVKRIKKTPEESTIEITLLDVKQKFQITAFLAGKGNYRLIIFTERFLQKDGSYSKVHFYTSYEAKDITDLL